MLIGVAATAFSWAAQSGRLPSLAVGDSGWWGVTLTLHAPAAVIVFFLVGGMIERIGFYWRGRRPRSAGALPAVPPKVCVQLPMYNEEAVARRVIEAAGAIAWPRDRLLIQVLDDSTDAAARAVVDAAAADVRACGIDCVVIRRTDRRGYKAGALEEARHHTDAEFLAIFDADFLPPPDYLQRVIGHFYRADGSPDPEIALVQAQWGHLNHDESALTRAQALWVDDHHTLQMSWRSDMWRFVNFTGTAGVWRAESIAAVGGWRAASLVEDCELSFRHLFSHYRTMFVKEVVVPAELPETFTAYKAQQKRWTQGWVQLQRLHLRTLLLRYQTPIIRRMHLLYHMLISWQWPAWALWLLMLPVLIELDLWFGSSGLAAGVAVYLLMPTIWLLTSAVVASVETRHTYPAQLSPREFGRRFGRVVPYVVISTGMLPHQFCAFLEGLFGPLHSEFERTPKTASVSHPTQPQQTAVVARAQRKPAVKIHWP